MKKEHRKVYEVRWYREKSSLHHRLFLYIGGIKMIISILLLIVGFVLLIKGADIFVDGASSTALNLKVSKMVIQVHQNLLYLLRHCFQVVQI